MKTIFKIEVITDSSGKWAGNAMTYTDFDTARTAAIDLANRWMLVQRARVIEVDDIGNILLDNIVFG